jgi:N-acetyl-gamma-glutamyl-phosphate reductase
MSIAVFIDGEAGTTGLQIRERLEQHVNVRLRTIEEARRKDQSARAALLNSADAVLLCLPDDAARDAVALITNDHVRVIDASTAHRTAAGWVYGFAEMVAGQRAVIASARFVSNPGCYATGAVALIRPLIDAKIIGADTPLSITAESGYSGGGKNMIARYEDAKAPNYDPQPYRLYGLDLNHKHLEEIRLHGGLEQRPIFIPRVTPHRQGMIVEVPLHLWALPGTHAARDIQECLAAHYQGSRFVTVASLAESAATADLYAEEMNDSNRMTLRVFRDAADERVLLTATLDNLGKGASGAAVQNLNIMFGFAEEEGL